MNNLTILEDQVMQMLLRGDDEVLAVLRQQAKQVQVSSRKMTGVGFFTDFVISAEAPRVKGHPKLKLGDVNGTADNVKHGLGFLLCVTDGALSRLEGYTYDEPWPDKVRGLVLTYSTGQVRKLDFQTSPRSQLAQNTNQQTRADVAGGWPSLSLISLPLEQLVMKGRASPPSPRRLRDVMKKVRVGLRK
jgi:hypothetical protein